MLNAERLALRAVEDHLRIRVADPVGDLHRYLDAKANGG
jgi:hypothetical protein